MSRHDDSIQITVHIDRQSIEDKYGRELTDKEWERISDEYIFGDNTEDEVQNMIENDVASDIDEILEIE